MSETKQFKSIRVGQSFLHDGKRYKKVDKQIASRWDKEKMEDVAAAFEPGTEVIFIPKPKVLSKPDRWNAACKEARDALDKAKEAEEALTAAKADVVSALESLKEMADEFGEPYDNMSEGLQQSPYGQKCEAMQQLDLEASEEDSVDDLESKIDEAENAEIPLGFGRD